MPVLGPGDAEMHLAQVGSPYGPVKMHHALLFSVELPGRQRTGTRSKARHRSGVSVMRVRHAWVFGDIWKEEGWQRMRRDGA